MPFRVDTELRPWEVEKDEVRRAGISAFGFGGTNFHVVMEEYLPGVLIKEQVIFPSAKGHGSEKEIDQGDLQTDIAEDMKENKAAPVQEFEAVKTYVLSAVSEKTGYPVEMLDLDLDLEADLGIDTVKQAELFATMRSHYQIPRREDLRLSDYNTLSKVVSFMTGWFNFR